MKLQTLCLLLIGGWLFPAVSAKENKPVGWAYVAREKVEVRPSASDRRRAVGHLGRGAIVEVYDFAAKGNSDWSKVRFVDLETLDSRLGWVDSSEVEGLPLDRFPLDAELLKQLGGEYLEDFVRKKVQMARFELRQSATEAALVCFLGSPAFPQVRLQIFQRRNGKFVPASYLELTFSEMKPAITAVEVRDLLGDENECLVTHEPFNLSAQSRGVNLAIRRISNGRFEKLWEAPLEFRNLDSFPAHYQVLQPQEKNIGTAGTVTKATVDFRSRQKLSEPVWKGRVEFRVPEREEPVESVEFEKVCAWDGTKFKPLR
jgi:hypothetical protein